MPVMSAVFGAMSLLGGRPGRGQAPPARRVGSATGRYSRTANGGSIRTKTAGGVFRRPPGPRTGARLGRLRGPGGLVGGRRRMVHRWGKSPERVAQLVEQRTFNAKKGEKPAV